MIKATKQNREAARNFLYAEARFRAWDNHDDMDESDRWEHTFNFLVKNKVSVYDFIKEYMPDEPLKAKNKCIEGDEEFYEGVFDSFDEEFGLNESSVG